MSLRRLALLSAGLGLAVVPPFATASGLVPQSFQRVGTLANYLNNAPDQIGDETVSEIVAATEDGMTLVYTDSPMEAVGIVDLSVPSSPMPVGKVALNGEPTSVDILGNTYALVAVNTSASYTETSGELAVIDIANRAVKRTIPLGGQPDSIKISKDGRYAAIAIENERDEDVNDGELPQLPAGYLVIVDLIGAPSAWSIRDVALTGLASYASEDPEPEFVDIDASNRVVVTMQENNHVAVVDLASGAVVSDFPMGTVSLDQIDATEDDVISLTESLADIPREPDAVAWIGSRQGSAEGWLATANEGDLFGGSRGFSIFNDSGALLYDAGNSFDHLAVRVGHYPESRSENKGSEPEAVEYGKFGKTDYLFVGSERGSFVAVYTMNGATPEFSQLLPAPYGPEGVLAIPQRNLLIASGENDDPSYGVRSALSVYELRPGKPSYPQIESADDANGTPIPWSALSGMVAVPGSDSEVLAVWDSYYAESRILKIDVSQNPALIVDSFPIVGGSGNYDPEGIAIAPDGSLWVASEGNASDSRPNRLLHLDAAGAVMAEIGLPEEIVACRDASTATGTLGSGFEGVAIMPAGDSYKLVVAQQRGWDYTTAACEDLDDDAGGLNAAGQPNDTRLWVYDPSGDDWSHISWELAAKPELASWVGLSEITQAPDGSYVLIERDNLTGDFTRLKTLVQVDAATLASGDVTGAKKRVFNLEPALDATNGWMTDKPEGIAILDSGKTFVVTDNDGVDDWSGETWFLRLGKYSRLFR